MRLHATVHRSAALALAVLLAVLTIAGTAQAAYVDPDDEGGTSALREQLDAAAKGYLDAKVKLDASQVRQQELTVRLASVSQTLAERSDTVQRMAAAAYRTGGMGEVAGMLGSGSPEIFVERLALLSVVAANEDEAVRDLADTQKSVSQAKAALETEIAAQRSHLAEMAGRKEQAEKALRLAGGGQSTSGFSGSSAQATPAPRNADGSWPAESCSVDDPTTNGCITPRTLHALNQAKAAGFTRYVSCHRDGGDGEHPKGRACDFSAQAGGFGGTATGADRTYGNNLAAYFVANASRLGVLYVIWYRQIWMPGSGWRAYSGSGSPAADHTNHVHLSEY